MTYDTRERSRWFAQPINLFRFTRGPLVWRYCTGAKPYVLGEGESAETFLPAQIARGRLQESVEQQKNNLEITFAYNLDPAATRRPATQDLGDNWRPYPPSQRVLVQVLGVQYGDLDSVVEWSGRVLSPKFTDTTCVLTCEPSNAPSRSSGPQRRWQRNCDVPLYSQGLGMCNVDRTLHALPATVTGVSGLTVTAAEFANVPTSRLDGGYVEWTRANGLTEHRTIMAHTGSAIVLQYGAADLAEGLQLVAYPGCGHNAADCTDYFDNFINYGGCLYKPVQNPYSGNRVS